MTGCKNGSMDEIFQGGLHEFLQDFMASNNRLSASIANDLQLPVTPMRLQVRHETHYDYDTPLAYSAQRLHLTPLDFASQKVVSWAIAAPGIEAALTYLDGFGNRVHLVTCENHRQDRSASSRTASSRSATRRASCGG